MKVAQFKPLVMPDCLGHMVDEDAEDSDICHGTKNETACAMRTRCALAQYLADVTHTTVRQVVENLNGPLGVPFGAIGMAHDRRSLTLTDAARRVAFSTMCGQLAEMLGKKLEKWPDDSWAHDSFGMLNCHWLLQTDKGTRRKKQGRTLRKVSPVKERLKEDWRKNARPELWYKSPYADFYVPVAAMHDGVLLLAGKVEDFNTVVSDMPAYRHLALTKDRIAGWCCAGKMNNERIEEVATFLAAAFPYTVARKAAQRRFQ
jgi:hypothetical protein